MTSPNWGINYEVFEDEKHAQKEKKSMTTKKDENSFIKSDGFWQEYDIWLISNINNNIIKLMASKKLNKTMQPAVNLYIFFPTWQSKTKIWQWINSSYVYKTMRDNSTSNQKMTWSSGMTGV